MVTLVTRAKAIVSSESRASAPENSGTIQRRSHQDPYQVAPQIAAIWRTPAMYEARDGVKAVL